TQAKIGDVSSHIEEAVSSYKTIQAYGRERLEIGKFGEYIKAALSASQGRIKLRAALTGMVIFLAFSAVGGGLWVGGHEVLSGEITAGALSAFIFYAIMVASSAGAISDVVGELQRALGATEGLAAIIHAKPEIKDSANPAAIPERTRGELEFN